MLVDLDSYDGHSRRFLRGRGALNDDAIGSIGCGKHKCWHRAPTDTNVDVSRCACHFEAVAGRASPVRAHVAEKPQHQGHARRHGALCDPFGPRLRRCDEGHQGARQDARAQPAARRRPLGHGRVRGAHARSFVGDPAQLTPAQMDRWCKDFDNWAFCDAMSFNLFDRTPHAWAKVAQWSSRRNEFEKRTAFALLWSLTVHDKRCRRRTVRPGPRPHRTRSR